MFVTCLEVVFWYFSVFCLKYVFWASIMLCFFGSIVYILEDFTPFFWCFLFLSCGASLFVFRCLIVFGVKKGSSVASQGDGCAT